jgi:hypothetical protein
VDLQLVVRAIFGLDAGDAECDVNFDGAIDAVDVQLVIRAIFGLDVGVLASVPDVMGYDRVNAEAVIEAAGLTVGTVTHADSHDMRAGGILSQDPLAGERIALGGEVDLTVSDGPPIVTWQRFFGGDESDYCNDIIAQPDGSFILAGATSSYGIPSSHRYALRVNGHGRLDWSRYYMAGLSSYLSAVKLTRDGLYLAGTVQTGMFTYASILSRTNVSGQTTWQHTYGNRDTRPGHPLHGDENNIYLAIHAPQLGNPDPNASDVRLFKLGPRGAVWWDRPYGRDYADSPIGVFPREGGGATLVATAWTKETGYRGIWLLGLNTYGGVIWQQAYAAEECGYAKDAVQCSDGSIAIAGEVSHNDASILKLDEWGEVVWRRVYESPDSEQCRALCATRDGGFALAGSKNTFSGDGSGALLMKIDADGNLEWERTYTAGSGASFSAISEAPGGGFALAGSAWGEIAQGMDIYFVRTDRQGNAAPVGE